LWNERGDMEVILTLIDRDTIICSEMKERSEKDDRFDFNR